MQKWFSRNSLHLQWSNVTNGGLEVTVPFLLLDRLQEISQEKKCFRISWVLFTIDGKALNLLVDLCSWARLSLWDWVRSMDIWSEPLVKPGAPSRQMEPVEGLLGIPNWKTQDSLGGLYISPGPGVPRDFAGGAWKRCFGKRHVEHLA